MIGKIIGSRYELLEKVGAGGMAVVYKAKCHLLNRFVAVKMLRDEYINDQEFIEKFKKEAQAAASLSHQNIVNIYDVGIHEEYPYIVMEFIDGITLKEYIAKYEGFLTNEEIANFSKQIAMGLEHAHSNQIIHRDIKPHNIMVSKDGTLKVADFGIASAITETTRSYSSEAIGSVRYSSPEQARGRNVDERTDLYSLGVLMYEMATRQVPFEGETAVEIALKHMKDDIRKPSEINSTFNKGLESIVMRSLLKDVNQRYQNAKELISDLDKIINNPRENVAFYDFAAADKTQKLPSLDALKAEKGENRTMKKTKTKKKNKGIIRDKNLLAVIGVVLLAFVTVAVVFFVTRLEPNTVPEPTTMELIDVRGMTTEEAENRLLAEGYKVSIAEAENNNQYELGQIYDQAPAPGTKLRPDYRITIYPSAGPDIAVIPNLVQTTLEDAKVKLNGMTFALGDVEYVNDDLNKGYIISQTPSAGTEAKDDEVIHVVVSLGPEYSKVIVPRLTALTLEEAQKRILDIGLEIDEITYENHPTIEKDGIISQSVAEGTEVELDTLINVVVSLGTGEEETDPDQTPGDENAITTKAYIVPLGVEAGQDAAVKVLYEKDGNVEMIYNAVHTATEEEPSKRIEVQGSGSGILSIFVNDVLITSISVDFSN
ncbi:Stk1 family PASTA domain-containing Ser/Thr kinase [Acidaminobacter sp. JC074]|uniref:Stk1 family PASTA domain-containing Ser/Thr kinase n=1 Tax=Acidaminobacter sp. JC074 TaxID=2530199 RepID=UPI001F111D5C|nr:Stk1 family PASTA domain-containing Ser/Thr kinase [Acidaminobacter sp. JC074]MCH4890263.1 Stk1 family PASTA domain-containing Ser/Thr kinase [Acidaminobacter sp. JC074]